jgi:hypothetical protein
MKTFLVFLIFTIPSACLSDVSWRGLVSNFFSSISEPDLTYEAPLGSGMKREVVVWKLRPIVTLPALKITGSLRKNAVVDVNSFASTGGGFSVQRLKYTSKERWYCTFSFSPLTLFFSGDLVDSSVDLSWAGTVGILNNLVMIGVGFDLGVVEDRNRLFGLVSAGFSFNN